MNSVTGRLCETLDPSDNSTIIKIVVGPHWTVVAVRTEEKQRFGMASSEPSNPHCPQGEAESQSYDVSPLLGKSAYETALLCKNLEAVDGPMKSICVATLNALLVTSRDSMTEGNARELLVKHSKDRTVAMIGHFPFVKPVKAVAKVIYVIELHPKEGDYPASMAGELVPKCDVVAMTASTIVNSTIDGILGHIDKDAYVMLMGQSSPLSRAMGEFVSAVGGVEIIDGDALMESAVVRGSECQGGLKGVRKILIEFH